MDNKKQKARFGFVDAVIIILILSVAAAITYLILLQNGNVKPENKPRTIEYSVKLTAIKEEYRSALAAGNEVFDSATDMPLGYISNIRWEPTQYYDSKADENGNIPVYAYSDVYDAYVTIVCDNATVDETGFCNIGNTRILVGSQIYFSSGYLNSVGYCTRFEIKSAG